MCTKLKYKSQEAANKDLIDLINNKNHTNLQRSYFCLKCANWHLTSKDSETYSSLKEKEIDKLADFYYGAKELK